MSKGLVHAGLQEFAERSPDRVAVRDGDRAMTYGELAAKANRLARLLHRIGVGREHRVGLYLRKSLEAVCGVYGVLAAGAAYVPLDPSPRSPVVRHRHILADCGVRCLIVDREQLAQAVLLLREAPIEHLIVLGGGAEQFPELPGVAVHGPGELDDELNDGRADRPDHCDASVDADDLAYILYTSGSTGAPKGVMLTHRNCLAFVDWAVAEFGVGPDDVLSSHAPLHFDLSTFDLFAASRAGACVDLVPARYSALPGTLGRYIAERGITVWYSVPSALVALVQSGTLAPAELAHLGHLRLILFAGEVFPIKPLAQLMQLVPGAEFANLYGPTETNVCTFHRVPSPLPADQSSLPIGRAIDGVEVFLVNIDGSLTGPGEVGEIWVTGPTVMRGYFGDPAKTAARLCPDPREGGGPAVCYRTGDLGRAFEGGGYELLGRIDHQIKSRGYRIELGEIEAALHLHEDVVECAVVSVPDASLVARIMAFVVLRADASVVQLRQHLSTRLPAYMVPELWEFPERLPRTSTDKVDRTALAARLRERLAQPA